MPLIPYRLISMLIYSFRSAVNRERSSRTLIAIYLLLLALLIFTLYLLLHAPAATAAILRHLMNHKQVFFSTHLLICCDLD